MHIEHVNLSISNLQRSIDFYCRLFDFRVRWQETDPDAQPAAHVGNDEIYLALFEASEPAVAENNYERVGLNHFGLTVPDLAPYRDRLAELGVTPHHEPTYDPGPRLYFFDSDHIEVELVQTLEPGG